MGKITGIVFDNDGTLVDTAVAPRALYDGINELLKVLRGYEIKLYVWTARGRSSTIEILESLGIIGQFELLSCGGESAPKPSAAGIADMLPEFDPSSVIVIGDSVGDMMGGSSYGAHCIGAMWGHGNPDAQKMMKDNGASVCFLNVKDCLEYLVKKIEE